MLERRILMFDLEPRRPSTLRKFLAELLWRLLPSFLKNFLLFYWPKLFIKLVLLRTNSKMASYWRFK